MKEFMKATYETALSAGIDIVPVATAAKVMAILYMWGNNENFTCSPKFNVEREYIQKRYHLDGGETPDPLFVVAFKYYASYLENYAAEHKEDRVPKWAKELIEERYGFKLIY